ncbi:alpha-L-fucosidase [uncultured Sunxiuqinia sp.]|uniref:alpha-L-fucosidase n=1 Tax=uncultured Sunxiuqinia sp. TaxID=1573825 RepID=UPI0026107903|nr:alpha-L-fucosidase [uncultured Sunxiuqinia sp.]
MKNVVLILALTMIFSACKGQTKITKSSTGERRDWSAYPMETGDFDSSWESLEKYNVPEWYRDAKLGFWSIIGPQAVPLQGDWYARNMYVQGSRQNRYHLEHYGHPSEFGYKDLIEMFNPTKLNYDELLKLYKQAGGKYAVILAVHHDNFDLWNSKYHEWNSVKKGPKRDLVGEFRDAALKNDMRFGVTTHLARSYSWFQSNKGADTSGVMKGVPYDGNNPEYEALYHKPFEQPENTNYYQIRYPINPPEEWENQWYLRIKDLIDQYEPDFMYFDGSIPFNEGDLVSENEQSSVGRRIMAHYYNSNMKCHGGKLEAVLSNKNAANHGTFRDGVAMQSFERGIADDIRKDYWQTETCIGGWYYNANQKYKSVEHVVHILIDIVSKNGNLLLNIPLHPDGSIDEKERALLEGLGKWMEINGEGLYGTRAWNVYGEGPSTKKKSTKEQDFNPSSHDVAETYTSEDFRYTCEGEEILNAFFMKWPEDGKLTLRLLAKNSNNKAKIDKVELLGSTAKLAFQYSSKGLEIELPTEKPCEHAWTLKVSGKNLRSFSF